ncbi:hypothetical protein HXX76_000406 [Chlamydomonas incerta]|uniref:Uncharacterized protein n=1 Tax=Chlamydomonas incerta TaxID=51695 RepID=A0A835WE85_CHLIN|nr:hypothetical protein HXX76_000406 [Chlamydomonas incerta]|eukprot:KAG2445802.1 hypothetical protein HXX76_000406 [Chlamydomonas incerta]
MVAAPAVVHAACSGGGCTGRALDEDDEEAVEAAADAAAAAACCHNCARDGEADGARLIQIRRNTYCDVLRAADAAALYDIGGVQQFSINGHKVVFLHARPQKSKPGAVSECGHCHRSLMDAGSRHCSLECKLNWQQRAPPLTQEQVEAACTTSGDPRQLKIPRRLTGDESPPQHQPAPPPPQALLPAQQQKTGPHSGSPFAVAGATPWQPPLTSAAAAGAFGAAGGLCSGDAGEGIGIGSGGASGGRCRPRRRSTGQLSEGFYLGLSGGGAAADEQAAFGDTGAAAAWAAELEPGAAASDAAGAAALLARLQPPQQHASRPPRPPLHSACLRPPLPRPWQGPAATGTLAAAVPTGPPPTAVAYGGQPHHGYAGGVAVGGGAEAKTQEQVEGVEAQPPPHARRWRDDAGAVGGAASGQQRGVSSSGGSGAAVPLAASAVLKAEHVDLARFLLDQLRAKGIPCGAPLPLFTAAPAAEGAAGSSGGTAAAGASTAAGGASRRRMSASDAGPPPLPGTAAAASHLQLLPVLGWAAATRSDAAGRNDAAAPAASAAAGGARPAGAGPAPVDGAAGRGGIGLKRRSASMDLGDAFRQPNFPAIDAAGAASGGYSGGYCGGYGVAGGDAFSEVTSPQRFGVTRQRMGGRQAAHGAGSSFAAAGGAAAADADALAAHMSLLSPSRLQRPLLPWERAPAAGAGKGGCREPVIGGSNGSITSGLLAAVTGGEARAAGRSESRRSSGDNSGTSWAVSLPVGLPGQPGGTLMGYATEPAATTSSNDDEEAATGRSGREQQATWHATMLDCAPRRVKARKGQPHQAALA